MIKRWICFIWGHSFEQTTVGQRMIGIETRCERCFEKFEEPKNEANIPH